jgi:hypothetical protein
MQLVIALIALVLGLLIAFGGWRFFLLLLPFWGFLVGFNLGTEATVALFNEGTFATLLSWIVGFVLAIVFAVLSYLYYYAAVALIAGGVGYALGAAAWGLIGNEQGFIAFVIGIVLGVVFAVGTLALKVPKLLIVLLTSVGGAALVVAAWFILTGQIPTDSITWATIGSEIAENIVWAVIWVAIAVAGILAQLKGPEVGPATYQFDETRYRYS